MGSIKDRNGMNLREAEDIKKRLQEDTELYKKDLHNPDNHSGVITQLEPDILECEVKWDFGSITMNKGSGGDGILVSSVTQTCPTLCNPMNRSTPGLAVHHQLLESTKTHVH